MEAHFFADASEFRAWLEVNAKSQAELIVGFYKIKSGKPSMSWSESVDQALCFGWIDGIRKSVDGERYTIRFTPRKPGSIWSAINIGKMEQLEKAGLMKPAGRDAFAKRTAARSNVYSHENPSAELHPQLETDFRKNEKAWRFFTGQPPSYKKVMLHWIMSAKQEKTRVSRLAKLIRASEELKRIV